MGLFAGLKATLIERITDAINVPGNGAVLAGTQNVVDFVLQESTANFAASFESVGRDA